MKKEKVALENRKTRNKISVSYDHVSGIGNPSRHISSAGGDSQNVARSRITSKPLMQSSTSIRFNLFLPAAASGPANLSKRASHPLSHPPLESHSSRLPFLHSVQLQPWSSPTPTTSDTQTPTHTALQGRHLAPLSGPGLPIDATGTPYLPGGNPYRLSVTTQKGVSFSCHATPSTSNCALNAVSEFSSRYPARSRLGINDNLDSAATEVFRSPTPSRSFRPP